MNPEFWHQRWAGHQIGFHQSTPTPLLLKHWPALGIAPGPWRKDLVAGKSITLPDGRVIEPDQVLGEEKAGTSLVVVGDVGKPEKLREQVRGADALVIEATYLQEEAAMAQEFGHTTAGAVAELAKQGGVGQLILTHVSRRYSDEEILAEASAVFPNTKLAHDFDAFTIRHEE